MQSTFIVHNVHYFLPPLSPNVAPLQLEAYKPESALPPPAHLPASAELGVGRDSTRVHPGVPAVIGRPQGVSRMGGSHTGPVLPPGSESPSSVPYGLRLHILGALLAHCHCVLPAAAF